MFYSCILDYNIGAEAYANKTKELMSSLNQASCTSEAISQASKMIENPLPDNTYQNNDFCERNSMYSNRATMVCDTKLSTTSGVNQSSPLLPQDSSKSDYYNFVAFANEAMQIQNNIERSQSMKLGSTRNNEQTISAHLRTQSLVEQQEQQQQQQQKPLAAVPTRKIPENLKLTDNFVDNAEPSPALSTCSGPYIPISECFSGSPIFLHNDPPNTPLNSLDPRFYDTPTRSHINIGLNLTNEQPYSPKRDNVLPVNKFNITIFLAVLLSFC